ncbi:alcohol dehydrogenase catalytic domain-containing protein [Alkalibaculum sp. M08DMB]|uniref:Alcohol dehydrogenase catalytic domain-containing protein n=1 Tax=Alkalibaculum sporogenes TaxID=2655001 RepID=A0A6A7K7C6_9FIRM|nr:galactitol-1-phosphate 5-dehydrogenase [Alkalibaculum sporogenes]MPW25334.1 alcohol dehydrogenase catalytic domain-containing protein [Alkalibaculum sporogenes]
MRAIKLYGIQDLRLEEVLQPEIKKEDEVLIKVKAVGICGSDLSRYGKFGPKKEVGLTFGHEFSGVIEEIGKSVTKFNVGDRVTVSPGFPCMKCEYCKKSDYSKCDELEVIGAVADGAFADYIIMPEDNVIHIPNEIEYDQAAMIEPSAVCVHGLYQSGIKAGDTVTVMGCGPIGLMTIQWAKVFGATKVIAIDVMPEKLEWAKSMGADEIVNGKEEDAEDAVKRLTNGRGTDMVFEAAGSAFTCGQVLALARKGGTITYLGIPYGDVNIKREWFEKIMRNELHLVGSWNSIQGPFPGPAWDTTIHFMKTGQVDFTPIITHRYDLGEAPDVFTKVHKRDTLFGKIIFFPEGVEK